MISSKIKNTTTVTFPINGMTSAACVYHLTHALEGLSGVENAGVSLVTEKASVKLNTQGVTLNALIKVVKDAGYDVSTRKISLAISGINDNLSANQIQRALNDVGIVISSDINLGAEQVSIEYLQGASSLSEIKHSLENIGLSVVSIVSDEDDGQISVKDTFVLKAKLLSSLVMAAIIMLAMPFSDKIEWVPFRLDYLLFILASPIPSTSKIMKVMPPRSPLSSVADTPATSYPT